MKVNETIERFDEIAEKSKNNKSLLDNLKKHLNNQSILIEENRQLKKVARQNGTDIKLVEQLAELKLQVKKQQEEINELKKKSIYDLAIDPHERSDSSGYQPEEDEVEKDVVKKRRDEEAKKATSKRRIARTNGSKRSAPFDSGIKVLAASQPVGRSTSSSASVASTNTSPELSASSATSSSSSTSPNVHGKTQPPNFIDKLASIYNYAHLKQRDFLASNAIDNLKFAAIFLVKQLEELIKPANNAHTSPSYPAYKKLIVTQDANIPGWKILKVENDNSKYVRYKVMKNSKPTQLEIEAVGKFTGFVTINRLDDKGEFIKHNNALVCDIINYKDGKITDIIFASKPTKENCRIYEVANAHFEAQNKMTPPRLPVKLNEEKTVFERKDLNNNLQNFAQNVTYEILSSYETNFNTNFNTKSHGTIAKILAAKDPNVPKAAATVSSQSSSESDTGPINQMQYVPISKSNVEALKMQHTASPQTQTVASRS